MGHGRRAKNDENSSEGRRPKSKFWSAATWRIGIALIWAGVLLLGLVAYQLWGTSIQTRRTQSHLAAQFSQLAPDATPLPGGVMARITAPSIDLDAYVVRGVRYKDLEKGPGWFTNTAQFGEPGISGIAGHRTSFDAPFADLDQLHEGEEVTIETKRGTFTYVVTHSKIVEPTNDEILQAPDQTLSQLALVTCHPKWTSTKRLVVFASLESADVTTPVPTTTVPTTTPSTIDVATVSDALSEGWLHDPSGAVPTIVWAAIALIIWNGARLMARRRHGFMGRAGIRVMACLPFVVSMYFFYENASRILPVNL